MGASAVVDGKPVSEIGVGIKEVPSNPQPEEKPEQNEKTTTSIEEMFNQNGYVQLNVVFAVKSEGKLNNLMKTLTVAPEHADIFPGAGFISALPVVTTTDALQESPITVDNIKERQDVLAVFDNSDVTNKLTVGELDPNLLAGQAGTYKITYTYEDGKSRGLYTTETTIEVAETAKEPQPQEPAQPEIKKPEAGVSTGIKNTAMVLTSVLLIASIGLLFIRKRK